MTVELMKKMLSLQLSFGTNHTIITPMAKREAMKLSADISIIGMRLNILAKESQNHINFTKLFDRGGDHCKY